MKNLQDIANLITVRHFLVSSIDNLSIKLDRAQIKEIQNKVKDIDKIIIEKSVALNLSNVGKETQTTIRSFTRESTEDTETVMKKFMASGESQATPNLSGTLPDSALLTSEPALEGKPGDLTIVQGKEIPATIENIEHNKSTKVSKPTFKRVDDE